MKANNPLKDADHDFLEYSKQVSAFFICVPSKMVAKKKKEVIASEKCKSHKSRGLDIGEESERTGRVVVKQSQLRADGRF